MQDALGRAIEIVVLAVPERPHEGRQGGDPDPERDRDQIEIVHHSAASIEGLGESRASAPACGAVLSRAPEPERVGDDQDRRCRHGHGCNQRRHMACYRDRDGDEIIGDRQREVLPDQPSGLACDGDRLRHRGQALAQEHQIGRVASDVRRRCRRHRGMRRHQRRRIVQAVTDHQDLSARDLKRCDMRDLSGRQDRGEAGNTELPGDRRDRGVAIAGNHLHPHAGMLEIAHGSRCVRPQPILETECREPAAVAGKHDGLVTPGAGHIRQRPFRPAEPVRDRAGTRLQAKSGLFGNLVEQDARRRKIGGGFNERAGIRVAGMRGHCRRNRDAPPLHLHRSDQPRAAQRQRAGLVEDDVSISARRSSAAAVLDHDAVLEQAPGRDDLDHGNSEAERAGTGDDQNGDGDGHGAMRSRRSPTASRRRSAAP